MGIDISIEEVEQRLISMSRKLHNEAIDEILEDAAEPAIELLEYNVPEDTKELKGTLGIVKKQGTGVKRKIHLGSKSKDRKIVERAYYQEHGHHNMLGKKWLKRSHQDSYKDSQEIIEKKLKESIMK